MTQLDKLPVIGDTLKLDEGDFEVKSIVTKGKIMTCTLIDKRIYKPISINLYAV